MSKNASTTILRQRTKREKQVRKQAERRRRRLAHKEALKQP